MNPLPPKNIHTPTHTHTARNLHTLIHTNTKPQVCICDDLSCCVCACVCVWVTSSFCPVTHEHECLVSVWVMVDLLPGRGTPGHLSPSPLFFFLFLVVSLLFSSVSSANLACALSLPPSLHSLQLYGRGPETSNGFHPSGFSPGPWLGAPPLTGLPSP